MAALVPSSVSGSIHSDDVVETQQPRQPGSDSDVSTTSAPHPTSLLDVLHCPKSSELARKRVVDGLTIFCHDSLYVKQNSRIIG